MTWIVDRTGTVRARLMAGHAVTEQDPDQAWCRCCRGPRRSRAPGRTRGGRAKPSGILACPTSRTYRRCPNRSHSRQGRRSGGGSRAQFGRGVVAELRAGRMVVIMDDEDRENEGDLIMAARRSTPRRKRGAFQMTATPAASSACPCRKSSSTASSCREWCPSTAQSHRTAFTVSVDLRAGTTTGVSSR